VSHRLTALHSLPRSLRALAPPPLGRSCLPAPRCPTASVCARCDPAGNRTKSPRNLICGTTWNSGKFTVKRKTVRKRLAAKLQGIGAELRRRMHRPIVEVGTWLRRVVTGCYNYHAVPGNERALRAFRREVGRHWRPLRRRRQRARRRWSEFEPLLTPYLPWPRVVHPYPMERFRARHPRQEPCAVVPPARICAGGIGRPASLPRPA
jgi:hypothetical protein